MYPHMIHNNFEIMHTWEEKYLVLGVVDARQKNIFKYKMIDDRSKFIIRNHSCNKRDNIILYRFSVLALTGVNTTKLCTM